MAEDEYVRRRQILSFSLSSNATGRLLDWVCYCTVYGNGSMHSVFLEI